MIHPIEYKSDEERQAYQYQKLSETIRFLSEHSPFYRNVFASNNYDVNAPFDIKKFKSLPLTSKENLQNQNENFYCKQFEEFAEWATTSGTMGTPVSFGMTKNDLDRLAKNEARSLEITGCTPEDRIQLMVTLDKRFMAGLAYYLGAQLMGCATIRVGSGSPGLQIDSIRRFSPSVIITVPTFLLKVMDYGMANGYDISKSSVKKIVCIGEPVRDQNFELNNIGKRIKEAWPSVDLYSTYASTEMCTAITECEHRKGGHIPTDLIYIEILDTDENEVAPGSAGEVVMTTFNVEGMPLLRYKTGDIAIKKTEKCNCGLLTPRLTPVLGRKNQMLKYKGTTIFPEAIYELLNGISWIDSYVVTVSSTSLDTDDVKISVAINNQKEDASELLLEKCQTHLRVKPTIEICDHKVLRILKFPPNSRKPVKLIDKRENKF